MLAAGSYESIVDDLLLPAAAALGDAWASGRLSVGRRARRERGGRPAPRPRHSRRPGPRGRCQVVVGLPPGSRHELGALAFAAALAAARRRRPVPRRRTCTVDGWIDAVTRTRARAAVIGVVTDERPRGGGDVVDSAARARRAAGRARRRGGSEPVGPGQTAPSGCPERVVDAAASRRRGRRPAPLRRTGAATKPRPRPSDMGAGSPPGELHDLGPTAGRRSAADSRVSGTRSNGRARRSRKSRPPSAPDRVLASHRIVSMPSAGVRSSGRITRWKPGSASASPGVSAQPGCIAVTATPLPCSRRAHSRTRATWMRFARA